MIVPFRIALSGLAVLFAFLFGATLENFLLELVRAFVVIEPSNAVLFNLAHLAVMLAPLALFAGIVSAAMAGEKELRKRFFLSVLGAAGGLAAFRIHQNWWILRGVLDKSAEIQTEFGSMGQMFFLEKVLPYIALGVLPGAIFSVGERETEKIVKFGVLPALGAFVWLLMTHKIRNLDGPFQYVLAFGLTALCGVLTARAIKRLKEF